MKCLQMSCRFTGHKVAVSRAVSKLLRKELAENARVLTVAGRYYDLLNTGYLYMNQSFSCASVRRGLVELVPT